MNIEDSFNKKADRYMHKILSSFITKEGILHEMTPDDNRLFEQEAAALHCSLLWLLLKYGITLLI